MYKAKPFQEAQHMVTADVLTGKENKGRDFSGTRVTKSQADRLRGSHLRELRICEGPISLPVFLSLSLSVCLCVWGGWGGGGRIG